MADNNVHSGHRRRMRERFNKVGFEGWSEHEVLEYILFGVFRRCDTNELAHRLIDTCGGLKEVFSAPESVLTSVPGIGEKAANYIKTIGSTFAYVNTNLYDKKKLDESNIDIYLQNLFSDKKHECFYVIMLEKTMKIITSRMLFEGSVNHADVDVTEVCRAAINTNAAYMIVAHNHPSGKLIPSDADIQITETLCEALVFTKTKLLEHYIVVKGKNLGIMKYMKENGMMI